MGMNARWILLALVFATGGCASKFRYDRSEELKKIDEFDQKVQISLGEEPPEPAPGAPAGKDSAGKDAAATDASKGDASKTAGATTETLKPTPSPKPTPPPKKAKAPPKKHPKAAEASATPVPTVAHRPPLIEDEAGFSGRRPLKDPFRVGEKVVHDVTYYGVSAGTLVMEVKPFAQVNGRKSYNFKFTINTSPLFAKFYFVDDYVNTLVDFETLVPSVYTLHVKESRQLRETRMLFEQDAGKHYANFWEKKVTDRDGEEEKKTRWEIEEYSQNVFSAIMYLRNFEWKEGVGYAFSVADSEENNVFRGKVVRREKLKTEAGTFDAIVIKPEVELKGKLKPTGENLVWLSDDDRKLILRIESNIKIGTLVSEIVQLDRGRE